MTLRELAVFAALAAAAGCVSSGETDGDPATETQIQRRIAEMATLRGRDYLENVFILGVTLRPYSMPHLIDALQGDSNPRVRAGCAQALGKSQDGLAVEPLARAAESDSSPAVRYEAAYNLGLYRDPRGLPVLFEALRSEDPMTRKKAIDGLRELTGLDFGYDPLGAPERRAAAAAQWEAWYREKGPAGVAPLLLPGGRVQR